MLPLNPIQVLGIDTTPSHDIRAVSPSPPGASSLPLGYDFPRRTTPNRATDIIDNLIQAIEESTPRDSPIQSPSSGYNKSLERARPSLKVKPLVYAIHDSTQASPADSTPMAYYTARTSAQQDIASVSHLNPAETMPFNMFKNTRPTTTSSEMRHQDTHTRQNASSLLPVDKQLMPQISHTSMQSSELTTPPLKAGYLDPRLRNAVKRYRPQSTPPDSRYVRSTTSTALFKNPKSPRQNNHHTSQPRFVKLKPLSSNEQQASAADHNPLTPQDALHGALQASTKNPKSWISAKLTTSLRGDQKSQKENIRPTSDPPKSFIRRHLGGHPTPQFYPNPKKKDPPPIFKDTATLCYEARVQKASIVGSKPQTNVDAEGRTPAESISYQDLRLDHPIPQPPTNGYPLTFYTKDGQHISIPTKSICSISRSALRRSAATSRYMGRGRCNTTTPALFEKRLLFEIEIPEERSTTAEPLTHHDLDHNIPQYSPVDIRDLEYVDLGLESANTACSSPIDPESPFFSENSTSTTPSSPVGSSEGRGSVDFDKRGSSALSRKNSTGMQSCITNWESLDGCTPQFVQSMNNMMENGRSRTPELDSPTSEYSDDVLPIEFQDCAPQVVQEPVESKFVDFVQVSKDRLLEPDISLVENQMPSSRPSEQSPMQEKIPTPYRVRTLRPHVARLIIPASPPSNIKLQTPVNKTLHLLPDIESLSELEAEARSEDMTRSAMTPTWRNQRAKVVQRCRSATAPSSPAAEETLVSAMTPSNLANALKTPPPTYYNQQSVPTSSNADEVGFNATVPKENHAAPSNSNYNSLIPARLTRPLGVWSAPNFFAPKGGLQLRISRRDLTTSKQEWFIESAVSYTPYLKCIGQTNPLTRKRDFWDTDGNHLFEFQGTVGSTRVAESHDGQALFVVRNASLGLLPRWTLTHKNNDGSAQWVARGDEECRNLVVYWGGFLVGRISVEAERLRNNYIVTVNPGMNYCIMAALTTVFDDMRVDEAYF